MACRHKHVKNLVTKSAWMLTSLFIYKKEKKLLKNLLEDLTMSIVNFNILMIYIIHKTLVLLKNHLNYHKYNIFKCFFKKYDRLLFYFSFN